MNVDPVVDSESLDAEAAEELKTKTTDVCKCIGPFLRVRPVGKWDQQAKA